MQSSRATVFTAFRFRNAAYQGPETLNARSLPSIESMAAFGTKSMTAFGDRELPLRVDRGCSERLQKGKGSYVRGIMSTSGEVGAQGIAAAATSSLGTERPMNGWPGQPSDKAQQSRRAARMLHRQRSLSLRKLTLLTAAGALWKLTARSPARDFRQGGTWPDGDDLLTGKAGRRADYPSAHFG